MVSYLLALVCGIIGVYKLREGLLILQDWRDEQKGGEDIEHRRG